MYFSKHAWQHQLLFANTFIINFTDLFGNISFRRTFLAIIFMRIFPGIVFLGEGKFYRNNFLESFPCTRCVAYLLIFFVYLCKCVHVYKWEWGMRLCVSEHWRCVCKQALFKLTCGSSYIYILPIVKGKCFSTEKPEDTVPLSRVIRKDTFVFRSFVSLTCQYVLCAWSILFSSFSPSLKCLNSVPLNI